MFSLTRSCFSRRLYSRGIELGRATLSNGGPASADKVYELRVYSIKPDRYATFCQLMATKFHRRLAYSRPLGYWLTDLGGIFQAVHIWPYESVSQRAEIRKALAQDEEWQEEFFTSFLQCADKLDNSMMVLCPGTSLCTDFQPSPSATYELLRLSASEAAQWNAAAAPPSEKETLVGRFNTVYGETNTEYRLLRYPDADTAFAHAQSRLEKGNKVSGYSRFMVPHDCSPIK